MSLLEAQRLRFAYDGRRGRMLFAGDGVLWAYDPAKNTWMLPRGGPGDPLMFR